MNKTRRRKQRHRRQVIGMFAKWLEIAWEPNWSGMMPEMRKPVYRQRGGSGIGGHPSPNGLGKIDLSLTGEALHSDASDAKVRHG